MQDIHKTRITLIERVQLQQDEFSWQEFHDAYNRYIYALILDMKVSNHDADDLSQEVLITLWKKIPEWDVNKGTRFRNWIAVITKNCVINFIQKKKRDNARIEKAAYEEDLEYLNSIKRSEIDQLAEKHWKAHITTLALKNIEPHFSGQALEVFRLSLQGIAIKEIAKKLGLKDRSVSQLKTRVKARLVEEIISLREELE